MTRYPVLSLTVALALILPARADAIPVFARRYKVSCAVCHNPIPKLNAFGEEFAANGYRFTASEEPRDTTNTGDNLLSLAKEFPLAMRLDSYAQAYSGNRAATDFQTPYGLKLMSSGTISKKLSYYFYTFLAERGEIGGVEDAFVQINDIGDQPVDLIVGQFQVSDPLFKRELRLEFEDYIVYRANIGEVPVNLTYDRGLMATADVAGFGFTAEVLNGNGAGAAGEDRRFDADKYKTLFGRVSREIGEHVRVGTFGYTGKTASAGIVNQTKMWGIDGTLSGGPFEFNGQYLHRSDDSPTYTANEQVATMKGGFAELIVRPRRSLWYGFGLYNLATTNLPLLDPRVGTEAGVDRYESVSLGFGRWERRNFRWQAEATYDTQLENFRWSLGFVTAF